MSDELRNTMDEIEVLEKSGYDGLSLLAAATLLGFRHLSNTLDYVAYGSSAHPGALERVSMMIKGEEVAAALMDVAEAIREYDRPVRGRAEGEG